MNIPMKCGYARAEARPDSKSSGMKMRIHPHRYTVLKVLIFNNQ
jgi:hypothetical protein